MKCSALFPNLASLEFLWEQWSLIRVNQLYPVQSKYIEVIQSHYNAQEGQRLPVVPSHATSHHMKPMIILAPSDSSVLEVSYIYLTYLPIKFAIKYQIILTENMYVYVKSFRIFNSLHFWHRSCLDLKRDLIH